MSSTRCPHCGLINPPGAARCDCGHELVAKSTGAGAPPDAGSLVLRGIRRPGFRLRMVVFLGVLAVATGLLATTTVLMSRRPSASDRIMAYTEMAKVRIWEQDVAATKALVFGGGATLMCLLVFLLYVKVVRNARDEVTFEFDPATNQLRGWRWPPLRVGERVTVDMTVARARLFCAVDIGRLALRFGDQRTAISLDHSAYLFDRDVLLRLCASQRPELQSQIHLALAQLDRNLAKHE